MKKYDFIDKVRVEIPCTEKWEEMIGNEQIRLCSHCAKHVNDLSTMTRKQALRLVRKSNGNLCIRYIQNPVTSAPVFANELVHISRRATRMAAGVMTASLSLATLSYAQGGTTTIESPSASRIEEKSCPEIGDADKEKAASNAASITGTINDPNDAFVANARVVLIDDKGNELRSGTSNEEGVFNIQNIAPQTYTLRIYSPGFRTYESNVVVEAGKTKSADATLLVGEIMGGVMVVSEPEYKGELALAVSHDDIDEARDLIAAGADVNGREEDKTTPLFVAIENGNIEIVRMLLDFGAKVNARNQDKETPLMKLDEDATRELVEVLLRAGAKVNSVSNDGDTPLMIAAGNAKAGVVQALIDAGADIDTKNKDGETALMNAAETDDIENVQALVLAGANVNLKDNNGETAWDKTSDEEIENFLVAHGAIVEDKEDEPTINDEPPLT